MGKSETEALPLLEDWEELSFIDPDGRAFSEIIKHERRKVGMTHDSGHAVKKKNKHRERDCKVENWWWQKSKNNVWIAWWNLMNPRGNERHLCNLQIMKLASHEKITSMTRYNLVHKFITMRQTMKNSGCKSCRGQGMDKAQDNTSMTIGQSQEQEGGDRWSTKRQKECPLCHIDGRMSPWKMRSFNPNYRSTKAESCFGWHCKTRPWSLRIFLNRARLRPRWLLQK